MNIKENLAFVTISIAAASAGVHAQSMDDFNLLLKCHVVADLSAGNMAENEGTGRRDNLKKLSAANLNVAIQIGQNFSVSEYATRSMAAERRRYYVSNYLDAKSQTGSSSRLMLDMYLDNERQCNTLAKDKVALHKAVQEELAHAK